MYAVGSNDYGQIGIEAKQTSKPVKIFDDVKKVLALDDSTFVLDKKGDLYFIGEEGIFSEKFSLIMKSIKDIGRVEKDAIYIITTENHYLTKYQIEYLESDKFTINMDLVNDKKFDKYFLQDETSLEWRNLVYQIIVTIDNIDFSTKIHQFNPKDNFYTEKYRYSFVAILLTDNRLLVFFEIENRKKRKSKLYTEIIPNIKTFYGDRKNLIWANTKGQLYIMPMLGPHANQKRTLESSPVVKILGGMDSHVYILKMNGILSRYTPLNNFLKDILKDVVDFDINAENKYLIKYI